MEQKSIFESGIWRVFEVFSKEPLKIHYIKEISKLINLAPTSVRKYVLDLREAGIVKTKKGERFLGYIADREHRDFLFYKKITNLIFLKNSGLIESLNNSIRPKAIILYGSFLRGEDVEESDIDLFIISNVKKQMNMEKFEEFLKRKIHIIIEPDIKKVNENLKSELINGEVLKGYLIYE